MTNISSCDIRAIAEKYGTPLYVYDKNRIIENYTKLNNAFTSVYPNTAIHYSVKANSNIEILRIFNELGSGVDCSSPIELNLSQKAGFSSEKIIYTGNYESPSDFETAYNSGAVINCDDITSFKRLLKFGMPEIVSFRINPGIGRGGYEGITTAGSDAKFGVPYEKAYDTYKFAKEAGAKRFGIHIMTGSNNLEPYYFAEIIDKLLTISGNLFTRLGIVPEYFDIGGGFGIPYEVDEMPLDIELSARLLVEAFIEKLDKYQFGRPKLILEPGRYLVGNAGWLLASVTGIKTSYKTFVGIDAGMNTLIRPALYGAKHRVSIYGKDELGSNVNLCGQICENSDIMLKNVFLPKAEEGDIAIIADTGAYGYSMASSYNGRLRPAEVLIESGNDRLIRRRETLDDILAMCV